MARSDQLKALIRSHAEGDDARFYAVALQVAAQAARSEHGKLAQELRQTVDEAQSRAGREASRAQLKPIAVTQPRGELAGLLTVEYPKARLADMVLDDAVRGRIERVLVEHRQQERLRQHGFTPLRKLRSSVHPAPARP